MYESAHTIDIPPLLIVYVYVHRFTYVYVLLFHVTCLIAAMYLSRCYQRFAHVAFKFMNTFKTFCKRPFLVPLFLNKREDFEILRHIYLNMLPVAPLYTCKLGNYEKYTVDEFRVSHFFFFLTLKMFLFEIRKMLIVCLNIYKKKKRKWCTTMLLESIISPWKSGNADGHVNHSLMFRYVIIVSWAVCSNLPGLFFIKLMVVCHQDIKWKNKLEI